MEATRRKEDDGHKKASPILSSLPPEIITEVFLRLPIRSIGRFRCVSKAFCSMFSDSGFAKRHLDLAIRNDSVPRKLLVSMHNLYSVDLDPIWCDKIRDLVAVELDYPRKDEPSHILKLLKMEGAQHSGSWYEEDLKAGLFKRNSVEIIGSSNGLVCIYPAEDGAFLYNPTTGESKRVPYSHRSKYKDQVEEFEPYGFGYDTLTDDYKVVKFVVSSEQGYHNADVYSLKKDSWRRISRLPYEQVGWTPGVHLKGALHWIVELHKGQNLKPMLVVAAFDLMTEEFREIPLPDKINNYSLFEVGTLKGNLCLLYIGDNPQKFIWVMKEYGLKSSWSKIRLGIYNIAMTPLSSTKNDEEVLLKLHGKLVVYNFQCNTRRNLELRGVKLHKTFEASTYVESLVSPNSYGNGCTSEH